MTAARRLRLLLALVAVGLTVLLAPAALAAPVPPLTPEAAAADAHAFLAAHLTGEGHYFVQLSDVHVGGGAEAEDGGGIFAKFHPSDKLARALDAIEALDPKPDFIIFTGDLADHGLAAELAHFSEILAAHTTLPTYIVRGNHDHDLALVLDAFGNRPEFDRARMKTTGVCYGFDWQGCRLVSVDTETYAKESPEATWLAQELAAAGERTVLAFGHRHTRPVGNMLADREGPSFQCKDYADLEAQLLTAPGFAGYFCGHVHYTSLMADEHYRQFALTSTFYALDAALSPEGGLIARLVHADQGKLVWTAVRDLERATRMEFPPAE
jgi:3',5'-cyclic-AMP phosphodiesterase